MGRCTDVGQQNDADTHTYGMYPTCIQDTVLLIQSEFAHTLYFIYIYIICLHPICLCVWDSSVAIIHDLLCLLTPFAFDLFTTVSWPHPRKLRRAEVAETLISPWSKTQDTPWLESVEAFAIQLSWTFNRVSILRKHINIKAKGQRFWSLLCGCNWEKHANTLPSRKSHVALSIEAKQGARSCRPSQTPLNPLDPRESCNQAMLRLISSGVKRKAPWKQTPATTRRPGLMSFGKVISYS